VDDHQDKRHLLSCILEKNKFSSLGASRRPCWRLALYLLSAPAGLNIQVFLNPADIFLTKRCQLIGNGDLNIGRKELNGPGPFSRGS
jgi:hypothetical protein